jgi:aspartokinase
MSGKGTLPKEKRTLNSHTQALPHSNTPPYEGLKFGGTSVGNAQNILRTIQIIQQKSQQDQVVVAVSAMGGVTDMLLTAGQLAATKNEAFRTVLNEIEQKHFDAIKELSTDYGPK